MTKSLPKHKDSGDQRGSVVGITAENVHFSLVRDVRLSFIFLLTPTCLQASEEGGTSTPSGQSVPASSYDKQTSSKY